MAPQTPAPAPAPAPAPGPYPAGHYVVGSWPVSRIFLLISAICFIIAAVIVAGIFHGPWVAWALGGVASYLLALAV